MIEFTIEYEKDGTIPYLEILVRKERRGFATIVYRKSTSVPSIIPSGPYLPRNYKTAASISYIWRALTHCSSKSDIETEMNGYTGLRPSTGIEKRKKTD